MDTTRLTRRQVLKRGGAVLAAYAVFRSSSVLAETTQDSSGATEQPELVVGAIQYIDSQNTVRIRSSDKPVVVKFTDDAKFFRAYFGEVAGLAAYAPGEDVVADGHWSNGAFTATSLLTLCRQINGHIRARRGNQLYVADDVVTLRPDTVVVTGPELESKSLADVGVGDHIIADTWRDPSSRERVALTLGVGKPES